MLSEVFKSSTNDLRAALVLPNELTGSCPKMSLRAKGSTALLLQGPGSAALLHDQAFCSFSVIDVVLQLVVKIR